METLEKVYETEVKSKGVCSANILYLIFGIIMVILTISLEVTVITGFFFHPFDEALSFAFILQLPAVICILGSSMIKDWKNRKFFYLYYCELKNGIDIEYIRENFSIQKTSERGILFVEKKDVSNYWSYKLLQGYDDMYDIEVKLFGESEQSSLEELQDYCNYHNSTGEL